MTEAHYLPVRESLGYRNAKKALLSVFHTNLDDISIYESEYENFTFPMTYRGYDVRIGIYETGKNMQFNYGEGGTLGILLDDPNYPKNSMDKTTFLEFLIDDPSVREKVEYTFGKNEKDVEYTMQVLKDYLDKRYEEEHK